ncbi:MAG: hypothetical protein GF344_11495 [Chitinivibrionales bacterium]|nr:hypothetical protein [Chitinivibrionales bacterium]MBD3357421.1 hypothetical protein [Chitinivibrionales bacterium]
MRIIKPQKAAWGILTLCALVVAGTLFEDNFNSDDNWVKVTGNIEQSLENGTYVIENNDTQNGGVLRNDNIFTDFTYSATFTCPTDRFSGTGILFCWSDTYEGYMLTLSSGKMYALHKWTQDGAGYVPTLIKLGWNSFINTSHNVLTVSKEGGTINLFCNNVFLASVIDSTYSSGRTGLYVGPSDKASYDHALVTDSFQAGIAQNRFCDDFSDTPLVGWQLFTKGGTASIKDEALELSAIDAEGGAILLTHGSYRAAPVQVVVSRTEGDDGFAGLILMKIDVTMSDQDPVRGYDAFVFATTAKGGNRDRFYAAHRQSTNSPYEFSPRQSSHINGTTDTLEITATYDFVINGDTMPDVDFGEGLDFNAIGLIADSGVIVTFDDFVAGESCSTVVVSDRQIQLLRQSSPSFVLGGTGILYDPRGRRVGRYEPRRIGASQARLAPGAYLAIPESGRGRRLRKAIIQVK